MFRFSMDTLQRHLGSKSPHEIKNGRAESSRFGTAGPTPSRFIRPSMPSTARDADSGSPGDNNATSSPLTIKPRHVSQQGREMTANLPRTTTTGESANNGWSGSNHLRSTSLKAYEEPSSPRSRRLSAYPHLGGLGARTVSPTDVRSKRASLIQEPVEATTNAKQTTHPVAPYLTSPNDNRMSRTSSITKLPRLHVRRVSVPKVEDIPPVPPLPASIRGNFLYNSSQVPHQTSGPRSSPDAQRPRLPPLKAHELSQATVARVNAVTERIDTAARRLPSADSKQTLNTSRKISAPPTYEQTERFGTLRESARSTKNIYLKALRSEKSSTAQLPSSDYYLRGRPKASDDISSTQENHRKSRLNYFKPRLSDGQLRKSSLPIVPNHRLPTPPVCAHETPKLPEHANGIQKDGPPRRGYLFGHSKSVSDVQRKPAPMDLISAVRTKDELVGEYVGLLSRPLALPQQSTTSNSCHESDIKALDGEMRKISLKRKRKDLDRELQFLSRSCAPKEAVSPTSALRTMDLNRYERGEIVDFSYIYFTGNNAVKKEFDGLAQSGASNFGYDDDRGDYQIIAGDHIAYRYEVLGLLGKGSFGQVARCLDHQSGRQVAIKIIRNKKRFHAQALVEVNILRRINEWDMEDKHHIIQRTTDFYFRGHFCIATELLSINLYEAVKANDFRGFSVDILRRFAEQLLQCLSLLHQHRVIHCDLKPENILLSHPLKSAIKVIDFGSSCFENEKVYTYIQSRFYRSPEVILGMRYGMEIDMWSLGCILAELYSGYPIFPGENEQEQLACIMEIFGPPDMALLERCTRAKIFFGRRGGYGKTNKLDHLGRPRPFVSTKGRRRRVSSKTLQQVLKCDDTKFVHFLSSCLQWDPAQRMSPQQGLAHDFIIARRPTAAVPTLESRLRAAASFPSTPRDTQKSDAGPPPTLTATRRHASTNLKTTGRIFGRGTNLPRRVEP